MGARRTRGPGLTGRALPRSFYERPVEVVARDLLGRHVRARGTDGEVVVRLTEVEAYGGSDDPASHAHRSRTGRNAVMFGRGGFAYVYFSYGMHWCMNVVTGIDGVASAVLLRAGEVVAGSELAVVRRPGASPRDLARGPARLARCLGLSGEHSGRDLTRGDLVLLAGDPVPDAQVATGPRVGISAATDVPWRWSIAGDPTVSAFRPGAARGPRADREATAAP